MEVIHRRCAGLDVHKQTVVACVRLVVEGEIQRQVRTFGTATADLVYATLAMLFGAAASGFLQPFLPATRIAAAVVLAAIAIRGMFRSARVEDREIRGPMYFIFLTLTMLNPPTVIYFVSLAVALPEVSADIASRAAFVAGAFLASLSWQELLAVAGAMLHGRLTPALQRVTAIMSGLIILALAFRIATGA